MFTTLNAARCAATRSALVAGISIGLSVAQAQTPPQAITAAADATAGTSEPERVIVTGSFIPEAESEGALPVTVESAAQLIKAGATTPAEGLRQLPSFIGSTPTENDSNGGNGSAFVNLRGLGAGNTLTLINGRRAFGFADINAMGIGAINRVEILKDGASAIYGSDAVAGVVNFVLLNGPGAPKYNGGEIDFLYGNTTNKDAHVIQTFVNTGYTSKDGRFSAVFSFNYYDRQAIYSRDRTLSQFADQRTLGGNNTNSGTLPGRVDLGGGAGAITPIDQTQLITGFAGTRPFSLPGGDGFNYRLYTPAIPGQEKFFYYGAFSYKLFNNNSVILYGDMMYGNTRQDNGLAPSPLSQIDTGNLGRVGPPDPETGINPNPFAVRTSPFNPFGPGNPTRSATLTRVRYRLIAESGNRRDGFDLKYYRFEGGLKGDINFKGQILGSMFYDLGTVYEQYKAVRTDNGDARLSSLVAQYLPNATAQDRANASFVLSQLVSGQALQSAIQLNQQFGGTFNPFLGINAPRSGMAPVFANNNGTPTGLTRAYDNQAAVNRAVYTANAIDFNQATLMDGRVGGTLMPNLAQGGFSVVIGGEYRTESQKHIGDPNETIDPVTGRADPLGFNVDVNTDYKRTTFSAFAELSIPVVVPTMKIPFVYALDFSAAIRWEQYTNTGQDPRIVNPITGVVVGPVINITGNNGGTPRFTMRWQPYQDLTFRASYGKSFAQPSFGVLFTPNVQNFPEFLDPLTGIRSQPPNGEFERGNPNLLPEKSDTYTVGLVFTPKQIKGLTLTVDFYQINTTNLIIFPSSQAQIMVTANARGGGGPNAPFAITQQQAIDGVFGVFRQPGAVGDDRFPDQINAGYGNAGKRFVEGLDLTAIYEWATTNFGKFTFTLGYNHFFYYNVDAGFAAGPTRFAGGNFQSIPLVPGAIPFNKGFFRTEWDYRGFYFGATLNYVGDYLNDGGSLANQSNFQVNTDNANPVYFYHRYSGAYVTLDLQLSYSFKKPKSVDPVYAKDAKGVRTQVAASMATTGNIWQKLLWGTTIRAGVNNVFDKYPPYDAGTFNDNYDTSTYTLRNRFWYVGINKKF